MLAASVTFFGMGVPQAGLHSYDDSPMWPVFFFFVVIPLLLAFLIAKSPTRKASAEMLQLLTGKKSCDYCGRENDEMAENCVECGTSIYAPQPALINCADTLGLILR